MVDKKYIIGHYRIVLFFFSDRGFTCYCSGSSFTYSAYTSSVGMASYLLMVVDFPMAISLACYSNSYYSVYLVDYIIYLASYSASAINYYFVGSGFTTLSVNYS